MDKKSWHVLEFDKVLHILAGYTSFSAGQEMALNWVPTTDLQTAERWQAETTEARLLLDTHPNVTIGAARDVRRPADNSLRGFTLQAEELLDIRNTLVAARNLRRVLLKEVDNARHLADIAELIEECPGLVLAISNTFDERGQVLDSASEKLARLRQSQRVMYGRIQEKLQRIINSSQGQYLQEAIVTMRNGRYVIPLKSDARGRIKGIVHDQSGSGATLWVEPIGTVELNNEYRGLQIQEQEEIDRILAELSDKVAQHAEPIKRVVERMAELDIIFARARYASLLRGVAPNFVPWRTFTAPKPPKHANEREKWTPPAPNLHPGSTIWISGARHPLLNQETVVPTDLTLDEETFIVLITGPNTGGKTVSLKTTGLLCLMAQSGMHLPAIEARLTLFDHVFADIGDEQSIEQSLSTFSAHITNMIRILKQVDDRSLVLLDELGSGTDPGEGAAIAQSIVNFLRDKGATTFVATHYPELKVYASQTKGATNASLVFDIETLSPTYELTIGLPGRSNAFAIARRLGMDETILQDALQLVGRGSQQAETILESIYDLREKITADQAGTRLTLKEAENERMELHRRLQQIEVERQQILQSAREQAQKEVEAMQEEIRRARRQLQDTASLNALKKVSKEVAEIQAETLQVLAPPLVEEPKKNRRPQEFRVGDVVRIKTIDARGEIVSIQRKEAVVAIGRLQMRTKLDELEFKERPSAEPESEYVSTPMGSSPGMELDLRGKRVEEGLSLTERYLDEAFLARLPWVRIIHGKGTGKMREAIRKHLSGNVHVSSWEEGKDGEGGEGVTVAKLIELK